jgi:S1-C subfamily serine protease
MKHRKHFSLLTLVASILFAALTVTLGFAQPKAESAAPAAPSATAPTSAPAAEPGVLVVAVQPGSPAEKAGIRRGDIILEANGAKVNDAFQLRQVVADRAAGDKLSVKLRHGDAEKSLSVTVGTQDGRAWIGVLPFPGRGPGMMDDEEDFGLGMRGYGPGRQGPDGFRPMFAADGALVESVTAGSPAEKAGLKRGDLILSVDGTTVDERNQLAELVSAKRVGDTITLSVASRGQEKARDVKATLEKKQDKDGPFLGVQYMPAPRRFEGGLPGPGMMAGAIVMDVAPDSPAARAGIQPRDVIAKVDGAAVTDPQQVVDAVAKHKPGDTLVVSVVRRPGASQTELTVTLGQNPKDAARAWLGLSMGGGPGFPGMRGAPRTAPSAAGANAPTL